MTAPRRSVVIVNGDDFGLTAGVNAGILRAHERGILRSTTVLAAAAHAGAAAELHRTHPELDVGVHLNFTELAPVAEPARVRSLVDRDGRFLGLSALRRRLLRGGVRRDEVYREAGAQIDELLRLGVVPTHWDAHHAAAFLPGLRGPVAAAAAAAGLQRARSPRLWIARGPEEGPSRRWRWLLERPRRLAAEVDRAAAHRSLARRFRLPHCRTSPGLARGDGIRGRWLELFRSLPAGVCEIVSHPGVPDAELEAVSPELCGERAVDLEILVGPEVADILAGRSVLVAGFRDL